ncbi:MAG: PaaI family thioesterase [Solirubrobacterales bacterium]|nr:PaaI family thioesterase [Solirubrobacterales bacterium]
MDFAPLIPYEETFDAQYGLQLGEVTPDRVTATVPVSNAVKQPMGLVHGGVYASIAEAITSIGTARVVYEDGMSAQGLSNQTSFLRPILEGTIHATATRRHRGRTTWIWEVDITDDAGRLCAIVRMTIAVRPLPAAPPAVF